MTRIASLGTILLALLLVMVGPSATAFATTPQLSSSSSSLLVSGGRMVLSLRPSPLSILTSSPSSRAPQHQHDRRLSGRPQQANKGPHRERRFYSSGSSSTRLRAASASASWIIPRGGGAATTGLMGTTPSQLFNVTLTALALLTVAAKLLQRVTTRTSSSSNNNNSSDDGDVTPKQQRKPNKPAAVQSLQRRFLAVFWLLRAADWLQGPYFYEVYASKVINGSAASLAWVSRLFLTGFASTALFGPYVGRAADAYGRKRATIAFTLVYALGAFSTKSTLLSVLFLGRVLSGIGTSLLFSAPESWLVAEAQSDAVRAVDPDGQYLSETFGLAYAGDSIVAIVAGQLAAWAATQRGGATGAFELSTVFLVAGGLLTTWLWGENKAKLKESETTSITEAMAIVRRDPKIMLVGAVQSLFEAAMYIFVLQWPPAMAGAVGKMFPNAVTGTVPYGTIFSCFMACCLLGSTLFGQLAVQSVPTEKSTIGMLAVATAAMSLATWTVQPAGSLSLPVLMASFFAFEACVGMYFPSIGTLRSRYVPDSHRSVIMNLFGIPLNVLVVSVFLSIHRLGVGGALTVSSAALGLATICMWNLRRITKEKPLLGVAKA